MKKVAESMEQHSRLKKLTPKTRNGVMDQLGAQGPGRKVGGRFAPTASA